MQHNYTDIFYDPSIFAEIHHLKPFFMSAKIQWVSSQGDGEEHNKGIAFAFSFDQQFFV